MRFLAVVIVLVLAIMLSESRSAEESADHQKPPENRDKFSTDFIKTFQDLYFEGNGEAAAHLFAKELMWKRDSRKEIEISCPSQDPPIISIRSLDEKEQNSESDDDVVEEFDFDFEEEGEGDPFRKKKTPGNKVKECLTLKLTGKNFDFSLGLNCPTD
jgi:hypothetical protein